MCPVDGGREGRPYQFTGYPAVGLLFRYYTFKDLLIHGFSLCWHLAFFPDDICVAHDAGKGSTCMSDNARDPRNRCENTRE